MVLWTFNCIIYRKKLSIRAEDKSNHIQISLLLALSLFFLIKVTLRQGKVFLMIQNVNVLIV